MEQQEFAQWLFNAGYGVICILGGWLLNNIRDSIRELKRADENLAAKVSQIEVLVAGKYATRQELQEFATKIFDKLDRLETKIDQKLDGKADK